MNKVLDIISFQSLFEEKFSDFIHNYYKDKNPLNKAVKYALEGKGRRGRSPEPRIGWSAEMFPGV